VVCCFICQCVILFAGGSLGSSCNVKLIDNAIVVWWDFNDCVNLLVILMLAMLCCYPLPSARNIRVMAIVWRLRGNIIRTALCWIVWHNVYSQQHTYVSSTYSSNRLGLSHWDPYTMRRGGCLELYYCNMMEWFWWDSSLILTNWFPSLLLHCWFGHLASKNHPRNDLLCVEWDV